MTQDVSHAEKALPKSRLLRLRIRRQDGADKPESVRFEDFDVPFDESGSIATALREIEVHSVAATGKRVAPVAWESGCLEEACGSCTMLINGKVRKACSTSLRDASPKGKTVTLEPLRKFPVLRDLVVDRSRMARSLRKVQAWHEIEAANGGPDLVSKDATKEARAHELGRCTSCGACLEACPEYAKGGDFVGAFALNQVRRLDLSDPDRQMRVVRLEKVMQKGGVADCGKAQNCVEVCPAGVPLLDSIQEVARAASKQLLFGWILK